MARELKPLYAALLRLDIEEYLISTEFDHVLIELDLDDLWARCESDIRRRSDFLIAVSGYTGYARDALGLFITELGNQGGRELLGKVLTRVLGDFASQTPKAMDFSEVLLRASELGLGVEKAAIEETAPTEKPEAAEEPVRTTLGLTRTDERDQTLCFVLMPFDEPFKAVYENAIRPGVEAAGLACMRSDEIFNVGPIIGDIWDHIQKAGILVADLTYRNPNVFYELGLAHAIDRPVVLITQRMADVPFDVRHIRCILYKDSGTGLEGLRASIQKTIESVRRR